MMLSFLKNKSFYRLIDWQDNFSHKIEILFHLQVRYNQYIQST